MGLLDGKVAVITGAGGGLGEQHALAMAAEGAAIVVNDLGGSRDGSGSGGNSMADQVVEKIKAAGGEATANYDDVSTMEGGEGILKSALEAFERVDVLVNNAGILRDKSFANMTPDMWDVVVKVHLRGTYCVSLPIYRHMKEREGNGVIISTSSTSGLLGNFGQTNYGAAKAGIAGFTRCLALEGKRYDVRVFGLAPVALTRLTDDLPAFQAGGGFAGTTDPALVSPLVTYLASDHSKDITGKFFLAGQGGFSEIKVVIGKGVNKTDNGGVWSVQEIADQMKAGGILLDEGIDEFTASFGV